MNSLRKLHTLHSILMAEDNGVDESSRVEEAVRCGDYKSVTASEVEAVLDMTVREVFSE